MFNKVTTSAQFVCNYYYLVVYVAVAGSNSSQNGWSTVNCQLVMTENQHGQSCGPGNYCSTTVWRRLELAAKLVEVVSSPLAGAALFFFFIINICIYSQFS